MRLLKVSGLAVVCILTAAGPARTAQKTVLHAFDAHTFAVTLPPGYTLVDEASPMVGYKRFGFVTAPFPDGTSGVIQIGLLDFLKGDAVNYSLREFATTMVDTKRTVTVDWNSTETAIELVGGIPAVRVEWSGTLQLTPTQTLPARGVMIMGIKDDVGFRLEVQDAAARAAQTVPQGERSIRSFVLIVNR